MNLFELKARWMDRPERCVGSSGPALDMRWEAETFPEAFVRVKFTSCPVDGLGAPRRDRQSLHRPDGREHRATGEGLSSLFRPISADGSPERLFGSGSLETCRRTSSSAWYVCSSPQFYANHTLFVQSAT